MDQGGLLAITVPLDHKPGLELPGVSSNLFNASYSPATEKVAIPGKFLLLHEGKDIPLDKAV